MTQAKTIESTSKASITVWREGESARVSVQGVIDEELDFAGLLEELKSIPAPGEVEIELDGVIRINSAGMRNLYAFISGIKKGLTCIFSKVSERVIDQSILVQLFRGPAVRVKSFYANYLCGACGVTDRQLLVPDEVEFIDGVASTPARSCRGCGKPMLLDDDEAEFFRFLKP